MFILISSFMPLDTTTCVSYGYLMLWVLWRTSQKRAIFCIGTCMDKCFLLDGLAADLCRTMYMDDQLRWVTSYFWFYFDMILVDDNGAKFTVYTPGYKHLKTLHFKESGLSLDQLMVLAVEYFEATKNRCRYG